MSERKLIMMNNIEYNRKIIEGFLQENENRPAKSHAALCSDCSKISEYLAVKKKSILILTEQSAADDFVTWLNKTGAAARTVKRRMCTLRAILRYSQSIGLIPERKIELSDNVSTLHSEYVSESVISRLYEVCSAIYEGDRYTIARAKMAVILVILCGFKATELSSLKVSDISDCEINFLSSKGEKQIRFFDMSLISDVYQSYLNQREIFLEHENSEYLFVSKRNKRCNQHVLFDSLNELLATYQFADNINFSNLRNTCIIRYYKNIPDYIIIAKLFDVSQAYVGKLCNHSKRSNRKRGV